MLFTFDRYQPPTTVEIARYKVKVQEYIPNPMRCRNCQLLGHTSKRCTKTKTCENCNLPPHDREQCSRTMCANCSDAHPSSSKTCPKYLQNKEILTIKTRNKCSMAEAKRTYNQMHPTQPTTNSTSFSERAKQALRTTLLEKHTLNTPSLNKSTTFIETDTTQSSSTSTTTKVNTSTIATLPPTTSALQPGLLLSYH